MVLVCNIPSISGSALEKRLEISQNTTLYSIVQAYDSIYNLEFIDEESKGEQDSLMFYEIRFFTSGNRLIIFVYGMDQPIPIWSSNTNSTVIDSHFLGYVNCNGYYINVYDNTHKKSKRIKRLINEIVYENNSNRVLNLFKLSQEDIIYDPYKVVFELLPQNEIRIIEKGFETPVLRNLW